MNKILLSFLFFALSFNPCYSQADNTVETITIGSGNTIETAKFNALRTALEQVSGSYLSANTLVINDKLISDNITSITSGSIQKYVVIEQIQKGNLFYTTIKSEVSPKKFAEFVSGKIGSSVSIKGGIYAANIKQLNFNADAELISVNQLGDLYSDLLYNSIYYDLEVLYPVEEKLFSYVKRHYVLLKLPLNITMRFTEAADSANVYLKNNLHQISLTENEVENYKKIEREVYPICIDGKNYFFRNKNSLSSILKLYKGKSNIDYINSFTINDGINKYKRYINLIDNYQTWINFRGYLKFANDLNKIEYIESDDYIDRQRIKGFNGEKYNINYDDGFEYLQWTNFKAFYSSDSRIGKDLLGISNLIGFHTGRGVNCIQLWTSSSNWSLKLNGYYTLDELEKINDLKIIKNASPKVNYTIK